jgi:hypothetical protein
MQNGDQFEYVPCPTPQVWVSLTGEACVATVMMLIACLTWPSAAAGLDMAKCDAQGSSLHAGVSKAAESWKCWACLATRRSVSNQYLESW